MNNDKFRYEVWGYGRYGRETVHGRYLDLEDAINIAEEKSRTCSSRVQYVVDFALDNSTRLLSRYNDIRFNNSTDVVAIRFRSDCWVEDEVVEDKL